ncbi:MAG: HPP family protein [bacterium]
MKKIIREFRVHAKNYILQCLLATLTVFIVLYILTLENVIIVASMGSTAFVVFALPKSVSAQPRGVIGGNIVGLLCGTVCSLITVPNELLTLVIYAIAVGLSIFIMVVIDTEHPPASGLALGVAISGYSLKITVTVITFSILLSVVHVIFKDRIRNLV